ncbi:hypothetical protein HYY75_08475 [bacterium]|nr:hypothetical protein [bacterium]
MRFLISFITLIFVPIAGAFSQQISSINFQDLIEKHRIAKRFDLVTHRFLGTPSEFRNIASISQRLAKVSIEIHLLQEQSAKNLASLGENKISFFEENFWAKLQERKKLIKILEEEKINLEAQVMLGTYTPDLTILPTIKTMINDVLSPASFSNGLVLNHLPYYSSPPIQFYGGNPYFQFLNFRDSKELERYLASSYAIGNFFPSVRVPIILDKRKPLSKKSD